MLRMVPLPAPAAQGGTSRPERRRRRLVFPAMAPWLNLPALGGAMVAAVALGIHLGESAIGLIDPVHFQGPAIHPRDRGAAIDPNRVRPSGPRYAELYGWNEGRTARLADCGDCDAIAARDAYTYSAVVPYFGGRGERSAAPASAAGAEPAPPPELEPKSAIAEPRIARYASYPVDSREAGADVPYYARNDVYLDGGEEDGDGPTE